MRESNVSIGSFSWVFVRGYAACKAFAKRTYIGILAVGGVYSGGGDVIRGDKREEEKSDFQTRCGLVGKEGYRWYRGIEV
jgi:hypothetical protein